MSHGVRDPAGEPDGRVEDHHQPRPDLGGTECVGDRALELAGQIAHLVAEQRSTDDVERELGHRPDHLDPDPVLARVALGHEALDRIDHQVDHAADVPLGHGRVEHHPVPSPGGVLVGEDGEPERRAQELVLDRLVVLRGALVEHVVDVVRVRDRDAHAGADPPADDVAALHPPDHPSVGR